MVEREAAKGLRPWYTEGFTNWRAAWAIGNLLRDFWAPQGTFISICFWKVEKYIYIYIFFLKRVLLYIIKLRHLRSCLMV